MGTITRKFANFIGQGGVLQTGALTNATTDLNPLKNDVATLALREAVNSNRIGTNLVNSFIDQFEDSSGLDTLTNSTRNISEEYVNSKTYGSAATLDWGSTSSPSEYQFYREGFSGDNSTWTNITTNNNHQAVDTNYWREYTTANGNNTGGHFCCATSTPTSNSGFTDASVYAIFDFKELKYFPGTWQIGKQNGYGDMSDLRFQYSLDNSTYTNIDFSSASVNPVGSLGYFRTRTDVGSEGDGTASIDGSYPGVIHLTAHPGIYHGSGNDIRDVGAFEARYIKVICLLRYSGTANSNAGFTFTPTVSEPVINATANFTGATINPADSTARSSLGLIVLYKDNSGTNTLNTDIVAQVSADGGSNYSTCTLTPKGNFDSSGTKIAIANDVSVTSGTDLKYKISFANQSDGSKEARITGVSLLY